MNKNACKKTNHIIYDVESILIPENHVRLSMKSKELDRYIRDMFRKKEKVLIYRYQGVRYLFMGDDFVIEEIKKE